VPPPPLSWLQPAAATASPKMRTDIPNARMPLLRRGPYSRYMRFQARDEPETKQEVVAHVVRPR
jgi:hypothetical protein